MGTKYLKMLIKIIVGLLCLCFIFMGIYSNRPTAIKEVVEQIDQLSIYLWKVDQVAEYKVQIKDELSKFNRKSSLQEGYYALGFLEGLYEQYEESNAYYLKALSMGEENCLSICGKIYKELAYNALALNDEENAEYYFKLAEKKASTLHNKELKSNLYRRFSQGVVDFTNYWYYVVPLLELVVEENASEYDYLEAHRLLTNIYLLSGYYEKSITYLLDAYKVSVWNDYEKIQAEVSIKLGQAYYLNGDYKQALSILERYVSRYEEEDFLSYIPQLVESYRNVYGYDYAIEFLNDYISKLSIKSQGWVEFWYAWTCANLTLNEGRVEEADQFIQRLNEVYDRYVGLQDTKLYLWKDKVELDYLVQTGIRNESIVDKYEKLYKEINQAQIYVTAKVNLLEELVDYSIKISNYELGYDYLKERLSSFKNDEGYQSSIYIGDVYEMTLSEMKKDKVISIVLTVLMGALSLGGVTSIVYLIWKKHAQIQALSNEIKAKQEIDVLTNTLTKEALYDCLEVHMEHDDILNFIVINIDNFKRYNEVYGYLAGDKVLQTVAKMIKVVFPEAYIARHAGHHFIIVTAHEQSACLLKLEYLLEKVCEEKIENTSNLTEGIVTISAGVSNGKIMTRLQVDQHINNATYKLELSKKRGTSKVTV